MRRSDDLAVLLAYGPACTGVWAMGRPPLSVASVAISYVCLPVRSARVACFSVQFADGSMTRAMSWMPTCLGDDSDRRCFGSPFSPCRRFFLESRPHRATSGRNLIDHAFLGKRNVRTRSTLLPRRRSERDAHARISCHRRPSSFARPREPFAHPVVSIHARVRGGVRGGDTGVGDLCGRRGSGGAAVAPKNVTLHIHGAPTAAARLDLHGSRTSPPTPRRRTWSGESQKDNSPKTGLGRVG
jgi:hypothetical protein